MQTQTKKGNHSHKQGAWCRQQCWHSRQGRLRQGLICLAGRTEPASATWMCAGVSSAIDLLAWTRSRHVFLPYIYTGTVLVENDFGAHDAAGKCKCTCTCMKFGNTVANVLSCMLLTIPACDSVLADVELCSMLCRDPHHHVNLSYSALQTSSKCRNSEQQHDAACSLATEAAS